MVRLSRRGQLVLVTAAVLAAALAPVVLAYLQLGYHADVDAGSDFEKPTADANRVLSRAVHEAADGVAANHKWGERRRAAATVRSRLQPQLETLEASQVESGTHIRIRYNETAARDWSRANCPRGEGRRFGSCLTDGSVVLQNRVGEATPLAVAFDLTITRERGTTELTLVVRT